MACNPVSLDTISISALLFLNVNTHVRLHALSLYDKFGERNQWAKPGKWDRSNLTGVLASLS